MHGVPYPIILYYNDGTTTYVTYEGYNASDPNAVISPHVYANMPTQDPVTGDYFRNFQVDNWGPAYGTLLCTDSDPVFVWNDRAYFCESNNN